MRKFILFVSAAVLFSQWGYAHPESKDQDTKSGDSACTPSEGANLGTNALVVSRGQTDQVTYKTVLESEDTPIKIIITDKSNGFTHHILDAQMVESNSKSLAIGTSSGCLVHYHGGLSSDYEILSEEATSLIITPGSFAYRVSGERAL